MVTLGLLGVISGAITAIFYDKLYHFIMKQVGETIKSDLLQNS